MKRTLLFLPAAFLLTAQSAHIYRTTTTETEHVKTAYENMIAATDDWQAVKKIVAAKHGLDTAIDLDFSPDFTEFVQVPGAEYPLVKIRQRVR